MLHNRIGYNKQAIGSGSVNVVGVERSLIDEIVRAKEEFSLLQQQFSNTLEELDDERKAFSDLAILLACLVEFANISNSITFALSGFGYQPGMESTERSN